MTHCPRCLLLFGDRAELCPDCGIPVVRGRPAPGRDRKREQRLVSVHRSPDRFEAEVLVAMLGDSGLRAVAIAIGEAAGICGDYLPGVLANPLAGGAWGDVYVLENDVPRARRLLEEYLANARPLFPESADADGPDPDRAEDRSDRTEPT